MPHQIKPELDPGFWKERIARTPQRDFPRVAANWKEPGREGFQYDAIEMNARELKRWLKAQGCSFANHKGGSGHLTVYRNGRKSQLPMHGKNKELGTGLVQKIKKDLAL